MPRSVHPILRCAKLRHVQFAGRRILDRRTVSYVPPVVFGMVFVLFGLAFAMDFRGLSSRAAKNSIWTRRRSARAVALLTVAQRIFGAVFALVAVVMMVLIVRG